MQLNAAVDSTAPPGLSPSPPPASLICPTQPAATKPTIAPRCFVENFVPRMGDATSKGWSIQRGREKGHPPLSEGNGERSRFRLEHFLFQNGD